jgi:hypothetical protein
MRPDIRLWTAIAMIGICAFSVAQGWSIVRFSLATVNIDSSEKRAEIVSRWAEVTGLAPTALQAELKENFNPSDMMAAIRRRALLSAILSIKPLSSLDWLALSGMQLITDQPMDDVLASLKLSMLTGPNEGYIMVERGFFGVSLWESLSPDLKRRVAIDLAAEELTGYEKTQKFRAVLSAKPPSVRSEVRDALLETGLSPKKIEQRLGF